MIKKFFKDTAIYGITNILARGLSFLLLPLYTRLFTPQDYGIIDILTLLTTLINLTVPLEISQGVARYYTDTQTPDRKIAYASTALWFTLFAYALFLVLSVPSANFLSQEVFGNKRYHDVMVVALFSTFLGGMFYLVQNQLRWQLQAKDYAISNILYTVVSPVAIAVFAIILKLGIQSIFYGNILASSVALVPSLYYARQSYRLHFDWQKCREMLTFSAPLVLSSISVFVSLYIDRIALQHLMSLKEVGLYGIGYRFASITTLFLSGFQTALIPLVYNHYNEEQTPKNISDIFIFFLTFILSIIIFFGLFSLDILRIFTTPTYYSSYSLIPILSAAIVLSNMYIFAPGLGIAKKTHTIALVNIISASTNTILNFFLIPLIGIMGAALATLISSLLSFSLYLRESQKYYPIAYPFSRIMKGIFIVFITLVIVSICEKLNFNPIFYLFFKLVLFTISIYFLVIKLLDIQKILDFLRVVKVNFYKH